MPLRPAIKLEGLIFDVVDIALHNQLSSREVSKGHNKGHALARSSS